MNVLAIESSGPIGAVAACRDADTLAEGALDRGMEHGRMLVSLVDRVVRAAGWDRQRDINLVAVSLGPGSFTGLRVGVACAKTLAVLVNKPIVGVCSFDAMAENAPAEARSILTALDAKRGRVYAAAYAREEAGLRRAAGPAEMTPEESLSLLPPPLYVMGDALAKHAEAFGTRNITPAAPDLWRIRAAVVARLALAAFRKGKTDEPFGLQPIYLRLAEAEERRLARERRG